MWINLYFHRLSQTICNKARNGPSVDQSRHCDPIPFRRLENTQSLLVGFVKLEDAGITSVQLDTKNKCVIQTSFVCLFS